MAVHLSKSEFLYGDSEYAKSQRKKYGDNYKAYKKSKEIVNPMEVSKKEYIAQKEAQYKEALLNLSKSQALWDNYRKTYDVNLTAARANNNGFSLTGAQKDAVLRASGDGAVQAHANFENAQAEVDYTLSLYNYATHGLNFNA